MSSGGGASSYNDNKSLNTGDRDFVSSKPKSERKVFLLRNAICSLKRKFVLYVYIYIYCEQLRGELNSYIRNKDVTTFGLLVCKSTVIMRFSMLYIIILIVYFVYYYKTAAL